MDNFGKKPIAKAFNVQQTSYVNQMACFFKDFNLHL
jgi:hypothetical protein